MVLPILGHGNAQDAAIEGNLLASQLPAFTVSQARVGRQDDVEA